MMPIMTNFEFGDIVLISFPFTDQRGHKQRPAVVINTKAYSQNKADIILMAITSQIRPKAQFAEITIENWKMAGLLKESVIKPVIFTVEKKLVRKVLGGLTQIDKQQLRQMIISIVDVD